jgi:Holliday junction DNA helicase RuvA
MIAKLTGLIDSLGDGRAVIDVGGVGYLMFCSGRTLACLGAGEVAEVLVETHVREDHIHLYGFIDATERDWFRLLTTVQGVGAKVALGLLSVLAPDALMQAVAAQDKAVITQAPGVGPKLAARILSELKDKIGDMALAGQPGIVRIAALGGGAEETGVVGPLRDAASALVNLGYQPSEALAAVSRAVGRLGDGASVEALIRAGLGELAPADARSTTVGSA